MKLKLWQKNLLTIVSIIVGGFDLLNLAFIVTALIIEGVMFIFQFDMTQAPPFPVFIVPAVIFGILTWFILQSKINHVLKAMYLVLPLMLVLVIIGILSSLTNEFADLIGAVSGGIFLVLVTWFTYMRKLPWMYYFTILYVAILIIFNIEIYLNKQQKNTVAIFSINRYTKKNSI